MSVTGVEHVNGNHGNHHANICSNSKLQPIDSNYKLRLDVEVCAKLSSNARVSKIREKVLQFLEEQKEVQPGECYAVFNSDLFLREHLETVRISDTLTSSVHVDQSDLKIHVYQCHNDEAGMEELDGQNDVPAAMHWLLPSGEIEGLWENLVFDSGVTGPPGTGKTSLCKALAHKLCVRMSDRFRYGQLVEINSHGLFSKWFSESGKLVVKLFQKIQELIDDPEMLVCILMDEVESLAAVRKASSGEPSDAIRVVNALLTQLDQIKRFPNVLILTTSNVTGAIDLAFVDRADIKQYIGLPSSQAIYKIYGSCIDELMRAAIITSEHKICSWNVLKAAGDTMNLSLSRKLEYISDLTKGLSGRTIRKLPFLAHALYLQKPKCNLADFLNALELAVRQQLKEREDLQNQNDAGIST